MGTIPFQYKVAAVVAVLFALADHAANHLFAFLSKVHRNNVATLAVTLEADRGHLSQYAKNSG